MFASRFDIPKEVAFEAVEWIMPSEIIDDIAREEWLNGLAGINLPVTWREDTLRERRAGVWDWFSWTDDQWTIHMRTGTLTATIEQPALRWPNG